MIISASRRTDIPAYFADWFFNRLAAGFVLVRNPMHPHQVSRVALTRDVVDGFVFWTKDPAPMLGRLDLLRDYPFYVQFTLTGYGRDVEPGLPGKGETLVPTFARLAERIGPERVIWRYDPIFLSQTYTADVHLHRFEQLARRLAPHTRRCTISFLDFYRGTERRMAGLDLLPFPAEAQAELAGRLAEIAHGYGLAIATCAEAMDLSACGIGHAHCIDGELLARIGGIPLAASPDKNQRPACGCAESIDIGAYNTCRNGCRYCYANYTPAAIAANAARHDPRSPLLIGEVDAGDRVTERKMASLAVEQMTLEL